VSAGLIRQVAGARDRTSSENTAKSLKSRFPTAANAV